MGELKPPPKPTQPWFKHKKTIKGAHGRTLRVSDIKRGDQDEVSENNASLCPRGRQRETKKNDRTKGPRLFRLGVRLRPSS